MADSNKDTIYIDIDDEITAIIDKVRASSNKVVALVLPKRATTLQSIVNMKLLKRAADENNKNLVLVTTEAGLIPLAGAVGLHVAKTPTSRPEIPVAEAGIGAAAAEEAINLDDEDDAGSTADNAGDKPVGELAAANPLLNKPSPASGIETVELDNADDVVAPAAVAAAATKAPKPKKDSKLHVPDFDRFRLLLIGGALLLLALIVLGYLALVVLPKATIAIKTNASNVNTNVDFTLSTTASTLNASSKIVPAKQVQSQKTYTGSANASGQKNNGDKATGQVTMSSACANGIQSVPAGTGISSGGQTYITQKATNLSNPSGGRSNCTFSGSTTIIAQQGGAKFNTTDNAKFTLAASSSGSYDASSISATGSANGGTDNIQTVITQADIDSAKSKINPDDSAVQGDLKNQLENQGLYAIAATYSTGQPNVTASAKVGDAASSVTVTQATTYTMLGANESDIKTLVDNNIKSQIDTGMQSILSRGITQGSFKLKEAADNGAKMNIQTAAEVGPAINTGQIAASAAGKKAGDIRADVKNNPDVTDVTVKLSPFWVSHAPKNVKKITVTVAKPSTSANGN